MPSGLGYFTQSLQLSHFRFSTFLSSACPTYIPSVPCCLDPKTSWSCSLLPLSRGASLLPLTSTWRWGRHGGRVPAAPGDAWRGRHPADALLRGSVEIPRNAPSPRFLVFTTDLVEGGHMIRLVCGPNAHCASKLQGSTRGICVI